MKTSTLKQLGFYHLNLTCTFKSPMQSWKLTEEGQKWFMWSEPFQAEEQK